MSRSRKRTPRSGDKKSKFFKRYANRRYRKSSLEDTLQHKGYKKTFCSYNICDYESIGMTFEEYWKMELRFWYRWRQYYNYPKPNKEQAYKEYLKWFIRK